MTVGGGVLTGVMAADQSAPPAVRPWPALFALCLGFFMILVDTTIVTVATPAIIEDLDAEVNDVVWVTSAYLLAYAVPVLITGRLGDRFGPRRIYLIGLDGVHAGLAVVRHDRHRGVVDPGAGRPGPRRGDDDAADHGRDHPDLPVRPPRPGDGAVGRHRRRRHPGRPDPRRRAGRRARLGVDLLHQHPGRRRRLRAGVAVGATARDAQPPVRLARCGPERRRHVRPGVRHPGGPPVRLGRDHRGHLGAGA